MRVYILGNLKKKKLLALKEERFNTSIDELHSDEVRKGKRLKRLAGFKEKVYSLRANDTKRLVFHMCKHEGEECVFILDVLPEHDIPTNNEYASLVGMIKKMVSHSAEPRVETEELAEPDEAEVLNAVADEHQQHVVIHEFNRNGIILSDAQEQLINAKLPLLVNGPPGSGKTSTLFITLTRLVEQSQGSQDNPKKYLYVAKSKALTSLMKAEWEKSPYAQLAIEKGISIDFKYAYCNSYQEVDDDFLYRSNLNEEQLALHCDTEEETPLNIDIAKTQKWFENTLKELKKRPGANKDLKIDFASFMQEKDIISGYDKASYLAPNFGKRNSLFAQSQRKTVYELYEKYLAYVAQCAEKNVFDFSLCDINQDTQYDTVFIDEGQDLSLKQTGDLKKTSRNEQVILSMDTHQDLGTGLSFRPHIKQLFTNDKECYITSVALQKSYRCPQSIVKISNALIECKHAVTGGLADSEEYSRFKAQSSHEEKGHLYWLDSRSFQEKKSILTRFKNTDVVVVGSPEKTEEIKKIFPNYTVFTPEEIKGLEFPCVISYQLFDAEGFINASQALQQNSKVNAGRNRAKAGQAQPSLAPIFNGVFTTFTRAQDTLLILQDNSRKLTGVLEPLKKVVQDHSQKNTATAPHSKTDEVNAQVQTTAEDWKRQVDYFLSQKRADKAQEVFNTHLRDDLHISFKAYQEQKTAKPKPSSQKESEELVEAAPVEKRKPAGKTKRKRSAKKRKRTKQNKSAQPCNKSISRAEENPPESLGFLSDCQMPVVLNCEMPGFEEIINLEKKAGVLLNMFNKDLLQRSLEQIAPNYLHFFLNGMALTAHDNKTFIELIISDEDKEKIFNELCCDNPKLSRALFSERALKELDAILAVSIKKQNQVEITALKIKKIIQNQPFLINYIVTKGGAHLSTELVHNNARFGENVILQFLDINPGKYDINGHTALIAAVRLRSIKLVSALLDHPKIDVNQPDKNNWTAIMHAVYSGNMGIIDLLYQIPNIDINNTSNGECWTPLKLAISTSHKEAISKILEHPNIDANLMQEKDGQTPFISAIYKEDTDVIQLIMDHHKVNVNQPDLQGGYHPIIHATKSNNKHIFRQVLLHPKTDIKLIDKKNIFRLILYAIANQDEPELTSLLAHPDVDVNDSFLENGLTLLMYAIRHKNKTAVRLILRHHTFDVNMRNKHNGSTLLEHAITIGNTPFMELLLYHSNIDVNKINNIHTLTPLMHAVKLKNEKAVTLLLQHKEINVNMALNSGYNALSIAITEKNETNEAIMNSLINLLLEHPEIKVNKEENNRVLSPLMLAIRKKDKTTADLLLAHKKIDVNELDSTGCCALATAISCNNMDTTKALLKHPKVDLNIMGGEKKCNPLRVAIQCGNKTAIELLLAHSKINVNTTYGCGNSILSVSVADEQYNSYIPLLLKCAAIDINQINSEGNTPLLIAVNCNHIEAVKLLLQKPGIQIDTLNKEGETALSIAGKNNAQKIIDLLNNYKHSYPKGTNSTNKQSTFFQQKTPESQHEDSQAMTSAPR